MSEDDRVWLIKLEALAEAAYDRMYDARYSRDATALYSDVKETMYEAIALAKKRGWQEDAERLEARLAHIKAVYRSQFW